MENEKILVYQVDMNGEGLMYIDSLKELWVSIEAVFFDCDKEDLIEMPYAFKIETVWMDKSEYEALEPFEL